MEVKTLAPGIPTAPIHLKASDTSLTGFKLSWAASTDSDGDIIGYYVSYRKKGAASYTTEVLTNQLDYTLTGLAAATLYEVRVRAFDNSGDYSDYATTLEVKTFDPILPTAPTGLVVSEKTKTSFKLSWAASTDLDGNVVSYHVSYRKKGESDYTTEETTIGKEYTFSGMLVANLYEVRVRALDNTGYYSNYATMETSTLFEFTYGGSDYDEAYSITAAADGGYLLAGYTTSYGAGSKDIWLVKVDAQNNKIWDKTYGGSDSEEAYAVTSTPDGNYIVAGKTKSYGAGREDMWVIKIDNQGDTIWTKTFGGSDDDMANSIIVTPEGDYILAGTTASKGAGKTDMWVVKVDKDGGEIWNKTYGESSDYDEAYSITAAADGGYL